MPKDLNNKPRKKNEIPVNERRNNDTNELPNGYPHETRPTRKGGCPSGRRKR